ncbi:MAG: hypothetical protein EA391_12810 [Balneolaceae bacterium]|nr:MAG: hypothetical protein EA391_12810 [Balneolaceae bacterium]
MLKYLNYFFVLLFMFSAAVQYNDPEPIRWMAIYLAASVSCLLYVLQKFSWKFAAITAGIAIIWAVTIIPDLTAHGFRNMFSDVSMMQQGTEEAREFLGLLLVAGWMLIIIIFTKKSDISEK